MAIPLRNGFRARVDADCPSLASWQAFTKAMEPLGLLRAVDAALVKVLDRCAGRDMELLELGVSSSQCTK